MFSEDYKRGVCLDDLDVGLDWNALINKLDKIISFWKPLENLNLVDPPFIHTVRFDYKWIVQISITSIFEIIYIHPHLHRCCYNYPYSFYSWNKIYIYMAVLPNQTYKCVHSKLERIDFHNHLMWTHTGDRPPFSTFYHQIYSNL